MIPIHLNPEGVSIGVYGKYCFPRSTIQHVSGENPVRVAPRQSLGERDFQFDSLDQHYKGPKSFL